jgi:P4 family phage/plasmid primase-like protien
MPHDNPPSATCDLVVIEGLKTNINNTSNHITIGLDDLKQPTNAFEVLMKGTPCRLFVDVDGKMSADTDEATFNNIVAEVQQKFCADDRIIGVRNSSHFKALNIKPDGSREIIKKISFTLIYNKFLPTCDMIKEYAVANVLPELQTLLGDTIGIETEDKENCLHFDTAVYRTNGKVRAINAYKYDEQPQRISKIVKGSMIDNVIQYIPADCEECKIEETNGDKSQPKLKIKMVKKTQQAEGGAVAVATAVAVAEEPVGEPVDNNLAEKLLRGLAEKRFKSYDDWFKMAIVVRQERWNYEMFDKVCADRKAGTKYDKNNNKAIFDGIQFRKEGGLTQATLWNWLKTDNKAQFEALQKERKDFYKQLDLGVADINYAKMFYSVRPDRYFYSDQSDWWEIRENNRFYNTGKKIPVGITNVISDVLREILEDQRKNLNPLDPQTKERSENLLKEYRRLGDRKPLENIASFLPKLCMVEAEDFDKKMNANTNLIAFKDCVYDLQTNQYRQIKPSDFISKTTRYNMGDKKSDSKQRKKVIGILESIFPDKDLRDYWIKCASLAFFTNRFEMLYILTGTGGNGKGLLTSFLKACGGDYVFTAETTFLTTIYKGGVANSCLASCDGVRIVLVSEPDNGEKSSYMNVEFVKSITGRDEICARFLNQNVKTFDPLFTILLSCNTKPEIRKLDKGLLRRLSIHPFLCSFVSVKKTTDPYEKIGDSTFKALKDDPAFVKEFMLYLIENAYANKDAKSIEMPEASKEAVNEYVEDNNQFKIWFESHFKSVAEIKEIVERQLKGTLVEGDTPNWVDVAREATKEEIKEWRAEHTHSTGDILKKYNSFTGGKMTPQMLLQAIAYNEIPITKTGGQKFLKYYEYLEEIESESE